MIELAFNSTMKLYRASGSPNYDGTFNYSAPETVKCYREDETRKVITVRGEEVTSKNTYYSTVAVGENDKIDGFKVLAVSELSMLGVHYYRSYI